MILSPAKYVSATFDGISAWALNVLPSVLPFMFFTKILSSFGNTDTLSAPFCKPCRFLFNTSPQSVYAFLMAIISGYPVGAKITSDFYMQGEISKEDAYKMTSFCSTSGPMFIVGAVGTMMLKSTTAGYIILLSHILGAILNGILYRKIKVKDDGQASSNVTPQKSDLSSIVVDSALSILSVGVIIAIFFVVITALSPLFSILPSPFSQVFSGLIEITRGCIDASKLANLKLATAICSFVIGFGGFSTILQSMTFLGKIKMPTGLFILQKFTHGIFSLLITLPLLFLL